MQSAFALAILASLGVNHQPFGGYVIHDSSGGLIEQFDAAVSSLDEPLRIDGRCVSACTMFLGYKQVCVTPNATFGFHAAFDDPRDEVRSRSAEGTAEMESYYPKPLLKLIAKRRPHGLTNVLLWLYGSDLIKMGVRACG